MLDVALLACETVRTPTVRKYRERGLTASEAWRREHGQFRDNLIQELYADSGQIEPGLYTIVATSPGESWTSLEREEQEMLNLDSVKVTNSKIETSARGRSKEEIPEVVFGWLRDSFENQTAKRVAIRGTVEQYKTKPREDSGQAPQDAERVVGDAGELAAVLRRAATELGYGLSLQFDRKDDNVTGVRFQAKVKRQRKSAE